MTQTATKTDTPYHAAWEFITRHSTSGGSYRLAKLVLSLYNGDDYPFSIRECLEGLDSERTRLAAQMLSFFMNHGEDASLRTVGKKVYKHYPHLVKLGEVMYTARQEYMRSTD